MSFKIIYKGCYLGLTGVFGEPHSGLRMRRRSIGAKQNDSKTSKEDKLCTEVTVNKCAAGRRDNYMYLYIYSVSQKK